ncbi:MAG: hypothetical protein ACRENC_17070, partial [Gemmatimonadaceae bacterium]
MTITMSLPHCTRFARRAIAAGVLLLVLPALPALARAQSSAYSLSDVVGLVKNKVPGKRVLALVKENCVSFSFDDDTRAQLRQAGATDSLVDELKSVCGPDNPKPTAPPADSAKPAPATPAGVAGVAGAAGASPAAGAVPPPDSMFPVKFRAAVVGADITVRPVPQMDMYIISPQNDTTRLSTDLDGAADGSFREGVYRIESAQNVTIGNA